MFASKIARFVITALIKSLAKEATKCDSKRGQIAKKNSEATVKLDKRLNDLEKCKDTLRKRHRDAANARDIERKALEAKAWNNRALLEKLKSIGM